MSNTREAQADIVSKLVEKMEQGVIPWRRPWDSEPILPVNGSTGKPYRGMNILSLLSQDFQDPRWVTFKQATDRGWSVKKGEKHSARVVFWHQVMLDKNGKTTTDPNQMDSSYPAMNSFAVFNAEQIEGIPDLPSVVPDWNPHERAEDAILRTGASIKHGGIEAKYNIGQDFVAMPHKGDFESADGYYAVLFHELAHWSGNEKRLSREFGEKFGDKAYAMEELVAEISAAMVCAELGVKYSLDNHASYLSEWVSVLKEDPKVLFGIVSKAQDAADMLMGREIPARPLKSPKASAKMKR